MKLTLLLYPSMKEFKAAPLAPFTKLMVLALFCWLVLLFGFSTHHPPLVVLIFLISFAVIQHLVRRVISYRITDVWIQVHRPLWDVSLAKSKLLSATLDPTIFDDREGTSGSYQGRFRSRRSGTFRAYASNPGNAVVLRFSDRIVVLSPKDPQAFIAALRVPTDSALGSKAAVGNPTRSPHW